MRDKARRPNVVATLLSNVKKQRILVVLKIPKGSKTDPQRYWYSSSFEYPEILEGERRGDTMPQYHAWHMASPRAPSEHLIMDEIAQIIRQATASDSNSAGSRHSKRSLHCRWSQCSRTYFQQIHRSQGRDQQQNDGIGPTFPARGGKLKSSTRLSQLWNQQIVVFCYDLEPIGVE